MKPRILPVWGGSMYGLDLKTGQSSPDWPSNGFNIMLPPIQGLASGDNVGSAPGPARGGAGGGAGGGQGAGGGAGGGGGGEGNPGNGGVAEKVPPVIYKNLAI